MEKNKNVTQRKPAIKEVSCGAFTQVQFKVSDRKIHRFPMEITGSSKHLEHREITSLWLTFYLSLDEFI